MYTFWFYKTAEDTYENFLVEQIEGLKYGSEQSARKADIACVSGFALSVTHLWLVHFWQSLVI